MSNRIEKDSLGEVPVPSKAYYGAQTQRAIDNFPISGIRFPRRFIWSLGLLKRCCAFANEEMELLDTYRAEWIAAAAQEVMDGKLDADFPLDIFQTGSGTSTNMNANEVISNRANVILGRRSGERKTPVHPNDHVNMGQSSQRRDPHGRCISCPLFSRWRANSCPRSRCTCTVPWPPRRRSSTAYRTRAGRTHLHGRHADAPGPGIRWLRQRRSKHGIGRVERARDSLRELAIGGTAVGTGINTHPRSSAAKVMAAEISSIDRAWSFREAENHFEAQAARDAVLEASSGMLKVVAASLMKIANDIRWLSERPAHRNLARSTLPEPSQPGSSIMPGKVNPVMSEMLTMAWRLR